MTLNSIAILMSTYNGHEYLAQQISSIQSQTNSDWHLYIRDDGSSDDTVNIIKQYAHKDNRIDLIDEHGGNFGVTGSFMRLLQLTHANYYMFSDQDDYWHPDKVQRALDLMQRCHDVHKPICVHSELQKVDAHRRQMGLLKNGDVWTDFEHFCFGNCITGCTVMINEPLKQILNFDSFNENAVIMHDWWIGLIASAFGKIIYDNTPTIDYRQHGTNVVGGEDTQSVRALVKRLLNLDTEINGLSLMLKQMHEFYREYNQSLTSKQAAFLKAYVELNASSSKRLIADTLRRYPPKRSHLRGRLLMSYLLLFEQKKVFKYNDER